MESPEQCIAYFAPFVLFLFIFIGIFSVIVTAVKALVFCRIFAKTGQHWALGLLMLVPIACLIMPFVLAFSKWPIEKQIEELKQKQDMQN